MGLFKIIGESNNPGSTGSVNVGGHQRPPRSSGERMIRFGIASVLLIGAVVGICSLAWPVTLTTIAAIFGGFSVYLVFGYFVRPRPDMDNLGWAGGLFDNPFRLQSLRLDDLLQPGQSLGLGRQRGIPHLLEHGHFVCRQATPPSPRARPLERVSPTAL